MKWTSEAEAAIKKVPFFVRKKVRTRVENEAREAGKTQVTLVEVRQTQKRFLSGMETDIKGYQIDEKAVTLDSSKDKPDIDMGRCLRCGQCIHVCPTGTIKPGAKGYRIQLGGKLGRHPRLGRELHGIFSEEEVLEVVKDCIAFYKKNSRHGERFAEIFDDNAFERFQKKYGNPG